MNQARPWTAAVAAAGLSLALTLAGCANVSGPGSPRTAETAEASSDPAAPAPPSEGDSGAAATGFPVDFDCADALTLAMPLGEGLVPSPATTETETELLCILSSEPETTILEGSELDLLVHVRYYEHQFANKAAIYCETARTAASALDDIDGCVIDAITSPNGIQATIPHFDIRVSYSCDASTECTPTIPVDEETALGAIERIGLVLHQG